MNNQPKKRRNKTIQVTAAGEGEIEQRGRRIKAHAWRIEGAVVVQIAGELLLPLCWVEPGGRKRVEALEKFHLKDDGTAWLNMQNEFEWNLSDPITAVPLPSQPPPEAIARLNVRFYREDGQNAAIAFWFDARHFHQVLEQVALYRRLMICQVKPTMPQIQRASFGHSLILELDEKTAELGEFVKRVK